MESYFDNILCALINSYTNGHRTSWITTPSTTAISSSRLVNVTTSTNGSSTFANDANVGVAIGTKLNSSTISSVEIEVGNLPMLASNCPGWVCYAEKTQPQSIPYISSTKSPQQLLGTIVKNVLFGTHKEEPFVRGDSVVKLVFRRRAHDFKEDILIFNHF